MKSLTNLICPICLKLFGQPTIHADKLLIKTLNNIYYHEMCLLTQKPHHDNLKKYLLKKDGTILYYKSDQYNDNIYN